MSSAVHRLSLSLSRGGAIPVRPLGVESFGTDETFGGRFGITLGSAACPRAAALDLGGREVYRLLPVVHPPFVLL